MRKFGISVVCYEYWRKQKSLPPAGCRDMRDIYQNFRGFSLMPGPMVLEMTAERI